MVDNFAAKYAALSIPYPGDQVLTVILYLTDLMHFLLTLIFFSCPSHCP